jgi:hypothetical protein
MTAPNGGPCTFSLDGGNATNSWPPGVDAKSAAASTSKPKVITWVTFAFMAERGA